MQNLHDQTNDRLTVNHSQNPLQEFGPEILSLLRRASVGHLFEEQIVPLHKTGGLMAALATRSLPWPSAGASGQDAEAIAMAAVGAGTRALLAPVITDPQHRLNIGLLAAIQRALLEALAAAGLEEVAFLVRDGSVVVQNVLSAAGFRPSGTVAVTDHAQFIAYCAHPLEVIERLGIAKLRQGDLLALRVQPNVVHQLTTLHVTIDAATQPHFFGRPEWAEILPGLVGWARYKIDGGINTPSPDPRPRPEDVGIEIVNPGGSH